MDKQQMYGIMSMEDIEQAFSEVERRIGVHDYKVSKLEQRWIDFNVWWITQQAQALGIVGENAGGADED
jgi:hypothetical protein